VTSLLVCAFINALSRFDFCKAFFPKLSKKNFIYILKTQLDNIEEKRKKVSSINGDEKADNGKGTQFDILYGLSSREGKKKLHLYCWTLASDKCLCSRRQRCRFHNFYFTDYFLSLHPHIEMKWTRKKASWLSRRFVCLSPKFR